MGALFRAFRSILKSSGVSHTFYGEGGRAVSTRGGTICRTPVVDTARYCCLLLHSAAVITVFTSILDAVAARAVSTEGGGHNMACPCSKYGAGGREGVRVSFLVSGKLYR